ncbi:MAG: hypothetical protein QOH16_1953 [Gaiellaceae bacterium]|jgi:hypothetical protein|nr:hypothetical protein [Gaiellaceae bacterium]
MAPVDPKQVQTRADFALFVRWLGEQDASAWESATAADYLESLAAWVEDWPQELEPSWSAFATAVVAATTYE